MKHIPAILSSLFLLACCTPAAEEGRKLIEPVGFSEVTIDDSFWSPRLRNHKETTIGVCIDHIENHGGFINNFVEAAKPEGGVHQGYCADDSDVYKALEGLAYSLQNIPDPELEARCDDWIDKIAAAQEEDGYLFTFNSLHGLEKRWADMDQHEMYCAGHLIEAAVAYYEVTGKDKILKVVGKLADHLVATFGPGKRDWVPGHEEIELALVKLYRVTGRKDYLDLADWLISERGHGLASWPEETNGYHQDIIPVREASDISGHAVRAMYLYCGMADVAAYTGDRGYVDALARLWDCVVNRNMYITGGIGVQNHGEGFGEPYCLPNLDAYCETCSSVGMILWNWRLNQFTGDAKYADVLERTLYNAALAGVSLAGDRFFYVNPLESLGDHHRQDWYFCACCPSQICRFLPSIGNYIYGVSDKALWVNLFIGNRSDYMDIETAYPWDGAVRMKLGPKASEKREMRIRIPEWCEEWNFKVNGRSCSPAVEKGYAVLRGNWKEGDVLELDMEMDVRLCAADPRVKDDEGKRAVQRGPIVYCLEEADNAGIDFASMDSSTAFTEHYSEELGGIVRVDSDRLHFIPYYAWDNREAGKMKVWVPFQAGEDVRQDPEFVSEYLTPRRIIRSEGSVSNPEALLQPFSGQVSTTEGNVTTFRSAGGSRASILLDFGKEIQGGIQIVTAISEKTAPHVRICFGESVSEALSCTDDPGTTATNEHSLRDFETVLPWLGSLEIGNTGFRFARIDLLTEDFNLPVRAIRAISRYRDIPYTGSFRCSDERLNRIWQTGAYTVHLNMQDYVWDGIKRDRLVWIGDMHPEVMTINTVFGDHKVVEKSLDFARDGTPVTSWMNGICSYSLWWIIIQHHLYQYYGDLDYLREQQPYLTDLLHKVIGNMDGPKENYREGRFIDWPSNDNPAVIHAGLQAISVMALEAGAEMALWLGDTALCKECREAAGQLRTYVPDHCGNKQAAALLAIEGMLDPQEAGRIIARDGASGFSSFMGYYMLEGLAGAGLYDEAFKCISDYWGTMLDLGATTFWEDFSYDSSAGAARIDEIVPEGKYDIHADGGRYCYVGLRHSFCHGWASGPTAFLSEHVLGVTPAEPGFRKIRVRPQLGSLKWVEGTVPSPYGTISVSHRKSADGSIISVVSVPRGVKVIDRYRGLKVRR